jgi:hypothetical protein
MMDYDMVKVFSATKAREREALGEKVTEFLRSYRGEVIDTVVSQSSDREFHCLTITLFGKDYKRRRNGERSRDQDV